MTDIDPDQMSLLDILERPPIESLLSPDQIYSSDEPDLFSRLSEDKRFDRKLASVQPKDIAKYLSGFGNGPSVDGGVFAIGVEKDGRITGCSHLGQDRLSDLESLGVTHCPDGRFETRRLLVRSEKLDDDFIILARIRYVEGKLVALTNGDAYERVGDECKRLSDEKNRKLGSTKASVLSSKSLVASSIRTNLMKTQSPGLSKSSSKMLAPILVTAEPTY